MARLIRAIDRLEGEQHDARLKAGDSTAAACISSTAAACTSSTAAPAAASPVTICAHCVGAAVEMGRVGSPATDTRVAAVEDEELAPRDRISEMRDDAPVRLRARAAQREALISRVGDQRVAFDKARGARWQGLE